MRRRIDRWGRLAVVLSMAWLLMVGGWTGYEYFTTGPWDYYAKNEGLVFFGWGKNLLSDKESLGLVFRSQRFWSMLLLPIVMIWAIVLLLIPAVRWVWRGFHT